MVEISTSLLSIKKEEATAKIYDLEVANTDYFHIDVMDGEFVENNTHENMREYTNIIKQISNIPLDIHLMVKNVKEYVDEYAKYSPNIITFHYEAFDEKEEIMEMINYIKKEGIKVGISIKPNTKLDEIFEFLPYVHMVLIMTVEPGKGGQKLILNTLDKIQELKKYITDANIDIDIEADGGINLDTIGDVKNAGVNIAVVGSGIIATDNYKETIKKLKNNNF